jgi:hypothetical protein
MSGKILEREHWSQLERKELLAQIAMRRELKNELSGGWLYARILDSEIADLEALVEGRPVRSEPSDADRIRDLETELARYKEREAHYAEVLKVADGGRYQNDWDAAIQRVVRERDEASASSALSKEHARLVTKELFGGGLTESEEERLAEVRRSMDFEETFRRLDRLAKERDEAVAFLRGLAANGAPTLSEWIEERGLDRSVLNSTDAICNRERFCELGIAFYTRNVRPDPPEES